MHTETALLGLLPDTNYDAQAAFSLVALLVVMDTSLRCRATNLLYATNLRPAPGHGGHTTRLAPYQSGCDARHMVQHSVRC